MERNIIILFTRENGGNTASFLKSVGRTESCEVIWASVLFSPFKRTLHASAYDRTRKHALRTASLLSRNDVVFIFGSFFGGIHIIDKTGHQCAGLLNIKNLTSYNSGFMM